MYYIIKNKLFYKNFTHSVHDDYVFLKTLGEGSYGKVFYGKNKHTDVEVAIKRIKHNNFKIQEIKN